MAKSSQTFKKRQRENKLREKAQQKRDQRAARRSAKKSSYPPSDSLLPNPEFVEVDPVTDSEQDTLEGSGLISAL